jgi:release factor glutamine methyltransferase
VDVLRAATRYLEERGSASPRLDAEVLLAHGLSVRRIDLYLQHDRRLSEEERDRLRTLVVERGKGVPVAHLTGEREFFSLRFHVTRDVLVPRPETEGLVEEALDALGARPAPVFCDVGTGSGCVAVSVLARTPDARAVATDVSAAAIAVATRNAERHGVLDRLLLLEGTWLDPVRARPEWGRLDAVVSNPPYVVRGDPALATDVAAHEPALALYAPGDDPLAAARAIATAAREGLRSGGLLAIEVGAGTGDAAAALLASLGFGDVRFRGGDPTVARVVAATNP